MKSWAPSPLSSLGSWSSSALMLHWCSLLSGFRKSRGRLVATLPERWRSGCKTDSSSGSVNHKSCGNIWIIKTYVSEGHGFTWTLLRWLSISRWCGHNLGVANWTHFFTNVNVITIKLVQYSIIVKTWKTLLTTGRMLAHVRCEVSRRPRVAGGRVFPL